jgi:hypothetical protein
MTQDAYSYRGEQAAELCLGRGLGGAKPELAVRRLGEHTIEDDHVTVQVEIGRRSKALQKGDTTTAAFTVLSARRTIADLIKSY